MSSLQSWIDERNRDTVAARAILDAAKAEKRDLSQEEENRWQSLMDNVGSLKTKIDREARMLAVESDQSRSQGTIAGRVDTRKVIDKETERRALLNSDEYKRAMRSYYHGDDAELRAIMRENRHLQVDLDEKGGYWVTGEMSDRIIQKADDAVYMRQWGTILQAWDIGVPVLEEDPSDPEWTAECSVGDEDTDMKMGLRNLRAKPLSKYIKVSNTLMQRLPTIEQFTTDRLAYKFNIAQEKAYLTGSGAAEPLGVFTASDDGVPTTRDISADNTTTSMTFDGLKNAQYALKSQYRSVARWLFHRDGIKQVSKLKDLNDNYLWEPSNQVGQPDMLLGNPAFDSEYVPNTFTTGNYVGMFADFSWYWIADPVSFTLAILREKFALENKVALLGRMELDGQPVLAEAFARITLA